MPASTGYADRVKDTSTSTGTGALTLSGTPPVGFRDFNSAFGTDGQRFAYCIDGGATGEWEVGVGYLSAATTLVREEVVGSSNANAAVNFSAGTKTIFNTFFSRLANDLNPRGRGYAFAIQAWRP
jgi:hypothetical protein